ARVRRWHGAQTRAVLSRARCAPHNAQAGPDGPDTGNPPFSCIRISDGTPTPSRPETPVTCTYTRDACSVCAQTIHMTRGRGTVAASATWQTPEGGPPTMNAATYYSLRRGKRRPGSAQRVRPGVVDLPGSGERCSG